MAIAHKIGVILLICGVIMLVSGLICAFTVGTILVPILVSASILVNSAGIMLMQHGGNRKRGKKR